MSIHFKTDICIIGGGIAGLWLLNRLQLNGYHCLLIEANAIGHGQTIASQGMIHGGMKYALQNSLTGASEAIAQMPVRWQQCLHNTDLNKNTNLDLSATRILSDRYHMWSDGLLSKFTAFIGSHALRGRIDALNSCDYPAFLQNNHFKGHVYQLNDIVLDVPSLLKNLYSPHQDKIKLADNYDIELNNGTVKSLKINHNKEIVTIEAQKYVLTAGEGNEQLIQDCHLPEPKMQRRPLHMVLVKHQCPIPIYAHCIGTGSKPRLTITTHPLGQGQFVWSLGGKLAETGVDYSPTEQIKRAQKEIQQLLPWLELGSAQWQSFFVNRAEPFQQGMSRPDNAFVHQEQNLIICWPTKLTLSPHLGDQIAKILYQQNITPQHDSDWRQLAHLPQAEIAQPLWKTLFS